MKIFRVILSVVTILALFSTVFCSSGSDDDDNTGGASRIDSLISEGITLLEEGNGEQARQNFLSALEIDPDNAQAHYGLSLADMLLVVDIINPYFDVIDTFTKERTYFVPQLQIDLKIILEGLDDLTPFFEEMDESIAYLEANHPEVTIVLESFPLEFKFFTMLVGEDAGADSLDFTGEWDEVEMHALGLVANFGLVLLDVIRSHDLTMELPDFDLPLMAMLGNLFADSKQFLTFAPEGQPIWNQAPAHMAAIVSQLAGLIEAVEREFASDDPQEDDVIPVTDTNGNGKLDFADDINTDKALPFTSTNQLITIMRDMLISDDAVIAEQQGLTFYAAAGDSLRALAGSLEGTTDRRWSFVDDLNPILAAWDFQPLADVAQIDFAAMWDDDNPKPLRDILVYYGCRNEEVDDCSGEKLTWINEEEPFTNDLYTIDGRHFTSYSNIEGLESIPPDNLYDVPNHNPEIGYVDLPSPTYLAFLDPDFSGALFLNLGNFPVLADLLIPKAWPDCSNDGLCNEQCYNRIDYDCFPPCDERCFPREVTDGGLYPGAPASRCGDYNRQCHIDYLTDCAADPNCALDPIPACHSSSDAGACFAVCSGWCPANQYSINTVLNWIILYFEHYVASVYNINFTEIIRSK